MSTLRATLAGRLPRLSLGRLLRGVVLAAATAAAGLSSSLWFVLLGVVQNEEVRAFLKELLLRLIVLVAEIALRSTTG